ncbi:MAG: putative dehydrogenase [Gammaproteobacteria bacterium]|jgi:putative dehydrogenase
MTDTKTMAVFGLGSMGYGVAQSLLRAGHVVYGFDVVEAQVQRLGAEGGRNASVPDVAVQLDCAVVVVLNAAQLEDVLFEKVGLVARMRPGSCILACPTVAPDVARDMEARCNAVGVHYLDAPISGGAAKSALGQLSVLAAGSQDAFDASKDALDAIAETVFTVGNAAGAGSAMKAVNQLLAGVHIATMAEAMTFGITQGIEPGRLVEVISQCAGTSWMFENRAPHIVDGDYAPRSAVNIWPKDLGIVREIAASAGLDAPMADAAFAQFTAAADAGLGLEDDAAVAKIYAANAGVTLPAKK